MSDENVRIDVLPPVDIAALGPDEILPTKLSFESFVVPRKAYDAIRRQAKEETYRYIINRLLCDVNMRDAAEFVRHFRGQYLDAKQQNRIKG